VGGQEAVWRALWPVLGCVVLQFRQASFHPKTEARTMTVATAKISVPCKSDKPDYSDPKAYRPMLLLKTISKNPEAVVATTPSYLAESYRLLLKDHFGGRLNRSSKQLLDLLVEKTSDARRIYKFHRSFLRLCVAR